MDNQKDFVLLNPNHSRTSHWADKELVDTLYHLEFPAEFVSDEYELRLIVYESQSHKPAAELGVWEPETTLATLRFLEFR